MPTRRKQFLGTAFVLALFTTTIRLVFRPSSLLQHYENLASLGLDAHLLCAAIGFAKT
jgi:hypothetical protein